MGKRKSPQPDTNIPKSKLKTTNCELKPEDVPSDVKLIEGDICKGFTKFLNDVGCGRDWEVTKILGKGDHGTIFATMNSKGKRAVVKVHRMENVDLERKLFNEETKVHKQMFNLGISPQLIKTCTCVVNDTSRHAQRVNENLSIQIIDMFIGTLDGYLEQKQNVKFLDGLLFQLKDALKKMETKRIVHADLALFNIGYIESKNGNGIKILIYDFDRSRLFNKIEEEDFNKFKKLDILRLFIELHPESRTKGPMCSESINEENCRYLRNKLRELVKAECEGIEMDWGDSSRSAKKQEKLYIDIYNEYAENNKFELIGTDSN